MNLLKLKKYVGYLWIMLFNLCIVVVIALLKIPYGSDSWGAGYFVFIRTWILAIHYIIHTLFFCGYYYLYRKKARNLKMIITILLQIVMIVLFVPPAIVFWVAI